MKAHRLIGLGIIAAAMIFAGSASAYGILATESGATIQSSRILVNRVAADEIQLIAQIKMSDPSSPAVWLIPIERKTSTQVDDNREVTVDAFSSSTLDELNLFTRPRLKPMCDGVEAGTTVEVPLRTGDFAPASQQLASFKIYPSDRADSLPNFFETYPSIELTEAQLTTLDGVKNNAFIFIAVYVDPAMIAGGRTSPTVSITYKTNNGGKLSLQSMVGSLGGQAPDLVIWSLDSARQQLPTPVSVDYATIQMNVDGSSNYDDVFDEAINRFQSGGFVTDMAQAVNAEDMPTAFLASLIKPGVSDYLTRFHARPVPAVLKTRIASVEITSGGGGDVPNLHEVLGPSCGADTPSGGMAATGGMASAGGAESTGGETAEQGGAPATNLPVTPLPQAGGQMTAMGGAQERGDTGSDSGSCAIGAPHNIPPSLILILMLTLVPVIIRRRSV